MADESKVGLKRYGWGKAFGRNIEGIIELEQSIQEMLKKVIVNG